LRRSYELWDALDETLLHRTGLVYFGDAQGEIINGVLASAKEHDLEGRIETANANATLPLVSEENLRSFQEFLVIIRASCPLAHYREIR
ncbi:MAG: hypothetical protein AAF683_05405, partial [Pseudomonadota bacterium]